MFTVPANGLYAFSWTTETHGELTETSLVANGVSRGSAIAHEIESHYDTTTSFAILELQANDIVYVNVTQGRAQGERTMFSGWKINDKGKLKLSRAKTYKKHKATPSIPNLFSELVYFFFSFSKIGFQHFIRPFRPFLTRTILCMIPFISMKCRDTRLPRGDLSPLPMDCMLS